MAVTPRQDGDRTQERLVVLTLAGVLAFGFPVLTLVGGYVQAFGLPLLVLYLFVAWAVFIGLVWAAMRSGRPAAKPVGRNAGNGTGAR